MYKYISFFIVLILSLSCQRVPPGSVGIIVDTTGAKAGKTDRMVDGGTRHWIGPTQELHIFPLQKIQEKWSLADQRLASERENSPHIDQSITFQDVQGLQISVDLGMSFQLEKAKIPDLFKTYRTNIEVIADREIRPIVQKAFNNYGSKHKVSYIYGVGKSDFIKAIESHVRDVLAPNGIILNRLSYLGPIRAPNGFLKALERKAEVGQKTAQRQSEIAQIEAEMKKQEKKYEAAIREKKAKAIAYAEELEIRAKADAKKILLNAEAKAKANELLSKSITRDFIEYEKMRKWNGVLPKTVLGDQQSLIAIEE